MYQEIIALCFFIGALFQITEAKDYGVFGKVFDIAETDLIEQIKERLQNLEKTGTLKDIQREIQRGIVKNIKTPKPIANIVKTEHPRTFEFDPTIELTVDLKDHKGKVFAKKGTKYNPLEMISFRKPLLFVDGDDANQVKWAMSKMDKFKLSKITLVKGSPLELEERLGIPIYFDQYGTLTKRIGIKQVPAIVLQEEGKKVLTVSEETAKHLEIDEDVK